MGIEPRRPPFDRTRYWHPPGFPGLSCLDATFTAQHFSPHAHDALVIAVTEAGGSSYTSRHRSAEASTSVLLVFNPAEPHAGHMRGSRYWKYRGFYLARPALDDLQQALGVARLPGFTRNAVADADLIRAFGCAHRAFDACHDDDVDLGRERLIDACGHLFQRHGDASVRAATAVGCDRTQVDAVLRIIRERFHESLSVDALARSVGVSPFQLIRRFNRLTGMPPMAHLLRARLHEAIRQLRHGANLASAAAAAGFYDQSALTRHFRRAYGITPGQYARARRTSA